MRRRRPEPTDSPRDEDDRFLCGLFKPYLQFIRRAWKAVRPLTEDRSGFPSPGSLGIASEPLPPSEMLDRFGNDVLYHPLFWEGMHNLAQRIAHPFDLETNVPGIDEVRSDAGIKAAQQELGRVFRLLTHQNYRRARTWRNERTLFRFDELRDSGKGEKQAVAAIAREQDRTDSAVRSDIERARKRLGIRKRAFSRRGPRRKKN